MNVASGEDHGEGEEEEDGDEEEANLFAGGGEEDAGAEQRAEDRTEGHWRSDGGNDIAAHKVSAGAGRSGHADHEIGGGGGELIPAGARAGVHPRGISSTPLPMPEESEEMRAGGVRPRGHSHGRARCTHCSPRFRERRWRPGVGENSGARGPGAPGFFVSGADEDGDGLARCPHLLGGDEEDGGEEKVEPLRRNDADEEDAGESLRSGWPSHEDDGQPDIGESASEEWSGAAAGASDDRDEARADGGVDIEMAEEREQRHDEDSAGHAEHAAERAAAERDGE